MIQIGNCKLGIKPAVIAVIDELYSIDIIKEIRDYGADLLEMRVDCYNQPDEQIVAFLQNVREQIGLPMIGTVRENDFTRERRVEIFKKILPAVDAVDLELGTPISNEVRAMASDKVIIISEHDFDKTPSMDNLRSMVERSLIQGAHIVKIATMAHSREDVKRLFHFTEETQFPIVTIAMGSVGTLTRVVAPLFGSLMTYGFMERSVAPGQLSAKVLIDQIKAYFPE
jgi:3-dehydroquinate dehydratase-1